MIELLEVGVSTHEGLPDPTQDTLVAVREQALADAAARRRARLAATAPGAVHVRLLDEAELATSELTALITHPRVPSTDPCTTLAARVSLALKVSSEQQALALRATVTYLGDALTRSLSRVPDLHLDDSSAPRVRGWQLGVAYALEQIEFALSYPHHPDTAAGGSR